MSVEWDVWAPTFAFIVPMLIGTVYMSVRQARWTRESRARREMTNYVDEKIRRLEQRIEAGERRLEGYCETRNRSLEARLQAISERAYSRL